jgi:phosphoglycerol transferase MdoB-like AlkP superfamily enzyme
MVIGQHRDLNRPHMFLSRNGLQQRYDENEFPSGAERLGLGLTDGVLFDFLRTRIEVLQRAKRPFFLATLTLSTHHPFAVPVTHPEVKALQAEPDGYVAALRYVDLEFERFFRLAATGVAQEHGGVDPWRSRAARAGRADRW